MCIELMCPTSSRWRICSGPLRDCALTRHQIGRDSGNTGSTAKTQEVENGCKVSLDAQTFSFLYGWFNAAQKRTFTNLQTCNWLRMNYIHYLSNSELFWSHLTSAMNNCRISCYFPKHFQCISNILIVNMHVWPYHWKSKLLCILVLCHCGENGNLHQRRNYIVLSHNNEQPGPAWNLPPCNLNYWSYRCTMYFFSNWPELAGFHIA